MFYVHLYVDCDAKKAIKSCKLTQSTTHRNQKYIYKKRTFDHVLADLPKQFPDAKVEHLPEDAPEETPSRVDQGQRCYRVAHEEDQQHQQEHEQIWCLQKNQHEFEGYLKNVRFVGSA